MKLFRNARFTTRNYECSNVVWCRADSAEQIQQAMPGSLWREVPEADLAASAQALWMLGPLAFFGWM